MSLSRCTRIPVIAACVLFAACADERAGSGDYADSMAREHAVDTPQSNVHAMVPTAAVTAGPVTYGAAGQYAGFEAYPQSVDQDTSGIRLPGIILIHEWWGLNENMRAHAQQLAGEGYRVLAVDLYGGNVAETPEEAQATMRTVMGDEVALLTNLEAAQAHLAELRQAPAVGVMGYCFGGAMALNAALAMPGDLDALVIYYGNLTTDSDRLETLEMPILGIFGAEDQSIPVEQVREFEETLVDLEKQADIHVFEGAGHAFANPSGDNFASGPTQRAWELTRRFLRENLGPVASPASPPSTGNTTAPATEPPTE